MNRPVGDVICMLIDLGMAVVTCRKISVACYKCGRAANSICDTKNKDSLILTRTLGEEAF